MEYFCNYLFSGETWKEFLRNLIRSISFTKKQRTTESQILQSKMVMDGQHIQQGSSFSFMGNPQIDMNEFLKNLKLSEHPTWEPTLDGQWITQTYILQFPPPTLHNTLEILLEHQTDAILRSTTKRDTNTDSRQLWMLIILHEVLPKLDCNIMLDVSEQDRDDKVWRAKLGEMAFRWHHLNNRITADVLVQVLRHNDWHC